MAAKSIILTVIEIDLRLPSMLHGKKGFERIVWAFKNVLNKSLAWLFHDLNGNANTTVDGQLISLLINVLRRKEQGCRDLSMQNRANWKSNTAISSYGKVILSKDCKNQGSSQPNNISIACSIHIPKLRRLGYQHAWVDQPCRSGESPNPPRWPDRPISLPTDSLGRYSRNIYCPDRMVWIATGDVDQKHIYWVVVRKYMLCASFTVLDTIGF